jgi:transcriptional regulator with XRE-family HTH domain
MEAVTIEPRAGGDFVRLSRNRLTGSLLAAIGQKAGYSTAKDRASILGISRSHLLHLERGEFLPSPKIVDAMAQAYKRPIEHIERAAAAGVERLAERKIAHVRGF